MSEKGIHYEYYQTRLLSVVQRLARLRRQLEESGAGTKCTESLQVSIDELNDIRDMLHESWTGIPGA